jgi:hypothetical protein
LPQNQKDQTFYFGSDDVKLPCDWGGGGLRGVLPLDAEVSVANALYSRERIVFNAMATLAIETPTVHEHICLVRLLLLKLTCLCSSRSVLDKQAASP